MNAPRANGVPASGRRAFSAGDGGVKRYRRALLCKCGSVPGDAAAAPSSRGSETTILCFHRLRWAAGRWTLLTVAARPVVSLREDFAIADLRRKS